MLFSFYRGVQPFYTARCFDELSRESILCLFTLASKSDFTPPQLVFFTDSEIEDQGVHQGDTGRIITRWRRPVASKVALDMLDWEMCLAPHQCIAMAVKMAHGGGTFVRCHRLFRLLANHSKITNNSHYKLTARYTFVHYNIIS
jgi:hypothetical protein